jgi:predicted branched-subunit amino acid permease
LPPTAASTAASAATPWRSGLLEAVRAPLFVLGIGYVGFGSVARSHDFGLAQTLLSTVTIWALPGQLILVEMHSLSAPMLATVFAVMLSAARFLPMAVTLLPQLRTPALAPWRLYAAAQMLAMSSWAVTMRRLPTLAPADRLPFYVSFGLTMGIGCAGFTAIGYLLATQLPAQVTLAFVVSNPIYFLLLLTADLRLRLQRLALAAGAIAGPLAHLVTPEWSVIVGGVVGGTVAFVLHESLRHG